MPKTSHAQDDTHLPEALPTEGRLLLRAAYVYDFVQPIVTLGSEARMNRWIASQLDLGPGARALDVGCGTGLLTLAIAERFPECQVEGIDASGPMIRVARRKRSRANCAFQLALAEELPYPDGHFDAVTSALFFHHVNRDLKRRCLAEICRTLKPGGQLLVADIGKPYTTLGSLLAYGAWFLFRQPEIKENIEGVLAAEIEYAGFKDISQLAQFSGYITVTSARKPS